MGNVLRGKVDAITRKVAGAGQKNTETEANKNIRGPLQGSTECRW